MSKADEALADVRRWLCDSLSDGDAGKVCGMLSVVSRRIAEIDEENAKLRELVLARFACDSDACESCADCRLSGSKPFRCVEVARELCVEVDG